MDLSDEAIRLGIFTAQEAHPEDAGGYLYIPESTNSPDAAVGMLRSVSLVIRYSPRSSMEVRELPGGDTSTAVHGECLAWPKPLEPSA